MLSVTQYQRMTYETPGDEAGTEEEKTERERERKSPEGLRGSQSSLTPQSLMVTERSFENDEALRIKSSFAVRF